MSGLYSMEGNETGMFEVPAGGRRYRALELLVKQKRMAKTRVVPGVVPEPRRMMKTRQGRCQIGSSLN